MYLLICISFKAFQSVLCGNPPVFCQQHFALQLPSFSQKVFRGEAILPRLAQQINSAFLAFHQMKIFNICYTCPSSLNCGIHGFWIGCVLSENATKGKQLHKAPITASTFLLWNTSSAAFVTRLENIRWACNCNQHRLNGNKLAN